ncbi:MAG: SRPBCC family protein [Oligoflexus sp.]|jgi:hypothetical protein
MKLAFLIALSMILITGVMVFLLPSERTGEVRANLPVPQEDVYRLVTDLRSQSWRSTVKELKILDAKDGAEVWMEIPKKGPEMKFKTVVKVKPERFEIALIDNPGLEAHWVGTFKATSPTTTEIHFVERVHLKSWLAKALSYLFFDVQASVDQYVEDLKTELTRAKEIRHG